MKRKDSLSSSVDNDNNEEVIDISTTTKISKSSLYLGIVTEQVDKNKLYKGFPQSSEVFPQPNRQQEALFSFSAKEYYPIGIISKETGNLVTLTSVKVKITIEYFTDSESKLSDDNMENTKYENILSQSKGIYWFGVIRGHSRGKIKVHVRAENKSDIDPLFTEISIVGGPDPVQENKLHVLKPESIDSKGTEALVIVAEKEKIEEVVEQKDSVSKKSKKNKLLDVSEDVIETTEDDSKKFKKSKVQLSSTSPSFRKEKENIISPETQTKDDKSSITSKLKSQKEEVLKDKETSNIKEQKSVSSVNENNDTVGDKSNNNSYSSNGKESKEVGKSGNKKKVKILAAVDDSRDWEDLEDHDKSSKLQSHESNKRKRSVVTIVDKRFQTLPYPTLNALPAHERIQRPIHSPLVIKGPQLSLTLPPAVSLALKDDRCRVAAFQVQYPDILKATIDQPCAIQLQYVTTNEIHPTVNELLYRLESKVSNISGSSEIIQSLRYCFEYYFISTILYKFEYIAMQDKLQDLEKRKLKYGDSFGAPFLLRLIVLIVVGIDIPIGLGNEISGSWDPESSSSSSSSSSSNSSSSSSSRNVMQLTNSQRRRNTTQNRQWKVVYERSQDVLQVLLSDLDEYAHMLFY